ALHCCRHARGWGSLHRLGNAGRWARRERPTDRFDARVGHRQRQGVGCFQGHPAYSRGSWSSVFCWRRSNRRRGPWYCTQFSSQQYSTGIVQSHGDHGHPLKKRFPIQRKPSTRMNKRSFLSLCAFVVVPSVSHAQIGNLLGGTKLLGSGGGGADLTAQQTTMVRNYVAAGQDVMVANTHLADALGVKAAMVNASATADSLSASEIEEQDKAISANAAAISDALKGNAKLKDSEAKTIYAKGLLVLALG